MDAAQLYQIFESGGPLLRSTGNVKKFSIYGHFVRSQDFLTVEWF